MIIFLLKHTANAHTWALSLAHLPIGRTCVSTKCLMPSQVDNTSSLNHSVPFWSMIFPTCAIASIFPISTSIYVDYELLGYDPHDRCRSHAHQMKHIYCLIFILYIYSPSIKVRRITDFTVSAFRCRIGDLGRCQIGKKSHFAYILPLRRHPVRPIWSRTEFSVMNQLLTISLAAESTISGALRALQPSDIEGCSQNCVTHFSRCFFY